MEMPQPILITGCARSGTSMVAGVINICGAFGGDMSGPNRNNMKGMFENSAIREKVVKPYLRGLGVDPMGQFPLPEIKDLKIPTDWALQIKDIMIHQGYPGGQWFYKGAKMALMWPIWHYAFPNAKWIIVRRKTSDIINSCQKTSFMRAFRRAEFRKAVGAKDERDGWLWWVHQHEARFIEMMVEGVNMKMVWPERMVSGNYEQMYETIEWLGLKWNSRALSFVDPKLWKARAKKGA